MRPGTRRGKNTPPLPETALLESLGVRLQLGQAQALESYSALVKRWNGVASLVARADLSRFADRHLLDSLILVPLLRKRSCPGRAPDPGTTPAAGPLPVADFGSGAGLPGLPLAVALPELAFTLVERSEKKARFLRRVRDELKLPNVHVLCGDFRQLPKDGFSVVVARAAMPVQRLWPHARAALAPGGSLFVLDRIVRSRTEPAAGIPAGCAGGAVRRYWTQVAELGSWHGVLEVREVSP